MDAIAEISCPKCKKRYAAGGTLAGKRVKCRSCGTLFEIPGDKPAASGQQGGEDAGANQPPLPGQTSVWSYFDGRPLAAGIRPNTKHKFPTAALLDRWLPFLMLGVGLIWVFNETRTDPRPGPLWAALIRFPILVLLYVYVIVPFALLGLRRAARALRFELPPRPKWRMAAVCSLPFMLGYALWLVSGASGALIVGLIAGLILTSPAFWVLLRPRDAEIVPSYAATCAGFLCGAILSAIVLLALGIFINVVMDAYHVADRLGGNPMGPSFSWTVTPKPTPPAAPPPATLPGDDATQPAA